MKLYLSTTPWSWHYVSYLNSHEKVISNAKFEGLLWSTSLRIKKMVKSLPRTDTHHYIDLLFALKKKKKIQQNKQTYYIILNNHYTHTHACTHAMSLDLHALKYRQKTNVESDRTKHQTTQVKYNPHTHAHTHTHTHTHTHIRTHTHTHTHTCVTP